MKNLKDLLAENMHRFGTKNLNEDGDQNNNGYPDTTENAGGRSVLQIQKEWVKATTQMADLATKIKNNEFTTMGERTRLNADLVISIKTKNKLEKELISMLSDGDMNMYSKLTNMPLDPSL